MRIQNKVISGKLTLALNLARNKSSYSTLIKLTFWSTTILSIWDCLMGPIWNLSSNFPLTDTEIPIFWTLHFVFQMDSESTNRSRVYTDPNRVGLTYSFHLTFQIVKDLL